MKIVAQLPLSIQFFKFYKIIMVTLFTMGGDRVMVGAVRGGMVSRLGVVGGGEPCVERGEGA